MTPTQYDHLGPVRRVVFAWFPVRISRIHFNKNSGHGWILFTGKTAWLRRVVHCEGSFDEWYEEFHA